VEAGISHVHKQLTVNFARLEKRGRNAAKYVLVVNDS
jgi:hypothetical protein